MKYAIANFDPTKGHIDTENFVWKESSIEEAKKDSQYTLSKYSSVYKERKQKGEVIDAWHRVSLTKTFDDAEKKEVRQADRAIQLGFKAMAFKISQECANIIVHNNIDKNKELIRSNIAKIVSTEYNKLYSALSVYEINEVTIASKLKEEWIKEIADALITIIYDGQDAVTRIVHINDRISIVTNDYSIYISNKVFNT